MNGYDPERMIAAVLAARPELADQPFRVAARGWHSIAVEAGDRLIFKFPQGETARRALAKEAAVLAAIRPAVSLPVPDMRLHAGPPPFSEHPKILGDHLLTEDYLALPEAARARLGDELGLFYTQLHRLDPARMRRLGAGPVEPWQSLSAIRERALPLLPARLRLLSEEALAAFERLAPDPCGTTFGFFDGHGWNMAFDQAEARLAGIYDFADSGIGPVHQEFIYSNMISPDLTERIVKAYERYTGQSLDRERIAILTGIHRLSELSEVAREPKHRPMMIRHVELWAAQRRA